MIRFVPKGRVEETHGERVGAAAVALKLKNKGRRMAARQVIKDAPKKVNASTELDRIGVAILEGLDSLVEGEVKRRNKAKLRAYMAQKGKEAAQGRTGMTDRERRAAERGGRGGGVEAQRGGVTASYVAAGRQAQKDKVKVDPLNKAAAIRRSTSKPKLQQAYDHREARRKSREQKPKLP